MFEIRRYTPADQQEWDRYVDGARNATFLFKRGYMDYHADRFKDHSLMFFVGNHLHSLLPAHEVGDTLYSHYGLTYGGLIMNLKVTIADTITLFQELNEYLKAAGFHRVIWHCHARLLLRIVGTTIIMGQHIAWRKDHRRRLKNAMENGIRVERDASLEEFWPLLEANLLKRFESKPVHTLAEMLLLKSRFPDKIIQYNAYQGDQIVGGITFYVTPQVLHGQYSSTNDIGKQTGAMEAIYERVMYHDYVDCPYLDFGSSTEEQGSVINEGLIAHKEGYGGRAVCYDTYEWEVR